MHEVEIYDSSGEELQQLTQWDKDVYITLKAQTEIFTGTGICQVHFFNKNASEALVVASEYTVQNTIISITCKIPNILLTEQMAINGHVVMYYDNQLESKRSTYRFRINIIKSPKPSDYIYIDSDDYVSLATVMGECEEYKNDAEEAAIYANASKNAASSSENTAIIKASEASGSATNAANSASDALSSANSASASAKLSQSYAVGGTNSRSGENTDNAKYYANQAAQAAQAAGEAISEIIEADIEDTLAEIRIHDTNVANNAAAAQASASSASASESMALGYKNDARNSANAAAQSLVDTNRSAETAKGYAESAEQSAQDAAAYAGSNLYSIALNPSTGRLALYYNGEE